MERKFTSNNEESKLGRLKSRIRTLIQKKNEVNSSSQSENDQKIGFNEAMELIIREIEILLKQNPAPKIVMPVDQNDDWKPKFHPGSPSYGQQQ
jgi:hypothetical protein